MFTVLVASFQKLSVDCFQSLELILLRIFKVYTVQLSRFVAVSRDNYLIISEVIRFVNNFFYFFVDFWDSLSKDGTSRQATWLSYHNKNKSQAYFFNFLSFLYCLYNLRN